MHHAALDELPPIPTLPPVPRHSHSTTLGARRLTPAQRHVTAPRASAR